MDIARGAVTTSVRKCELVKAEAQHELEKAEDWVATVKAAVENELEKAVAQWWRGRPTCASTSRSRLRPSRTARVAETTIVHKDELVEAVVPGPRRGRGGRRVPRCSARGRV